MSESPNESPSSKPAEPAVIARPPRRAATERVVEWLMRREALKSANARASALPPVKPAHLARALAAANGAEKLVDTAGATPDEGTEIAQGALALSLYREAAYWALTASGSNEAKDLAAAMDTTPAEQLVEAAGSEPALSAARRALVERSFRDTAALDLVALRADLASARTFVAGLLAVLDVRGRLIPKLKRERTMRLAGAVLAVVALLVLTPWLLHRFGPNRVENAPWRASSTSEGLPDSGVGFHPREGWWNVFFHTRAENSPWIEFDLGSVQTVSYVGVNNRMDCCQERATPLVFEVSTDHTHWTEAARQVEKFYTWHTMFWPRQARYVRLRALRPTVLHLGSVRVN